MEVYTRQPSPVTSVSTGWGLTALAKGPSSDCLKLVCLMSGLSVTRPAYIGPVEAGATLNNKELFSNVFLRSFRQLRQGHFFLYTSAFLGA